MKRSTPVVAVVTALVVPLVVVAVALATRPWIPVLDMAMTELRVRDVGGRHTPLVGLPGRIGTTIQEQGSHPGPLSFWLVAPFYRLAGARAWGLELASCVLNAACLAGIVLLGRRRFGLIGTVVFGALAAIVVRGYGMGVLSHPWNPYFPVLWWLLALVAAWLVLDGDNRLAPLVVVATSVAAQTHVPYLVNALAIDALVLGVLVYRWRRGAVSPRLVGTTVATAAVLWLPPFAQQVFGTEGNVAKLIRHFTTEQPEPAIGPWAALRLVVAHLDWFRLTFDLIGRSDAFVHRAGLAGEPHRSLSPGGSVVVVLLAAAAGWAWRRRHRTLLAIHTVIGVTLLVGLVSSSRIFGKVWYYLTLWLSSTAVLALVALVWTAVLVAGERGVRSSTRALLTTAAAVIAAATVGSTVGAVRQRPPEEALGANVGLALPELISELDPAHRYLVFWQESVVPGSQGYALLNELERRGYDVGVQPTFHVPATDHRVFPPGTFDAEIHAVSGGWVAAWPTEHPGALELATVDHRDRAGRQRFDELDRRVAARLRQIGRAEMIEVVDRNLFGASLDPTLPTDVVADLSEMILIGEPLTIFLAPPGSTR